MKDLKRKKGYLLVDLALGLFLMGILFLIIGSEFKIYIKNNVYTKEKVEVLDKISALSMEIKHNMSFDKIRNFKEKYYKLKDFKIEDLINKEIYDFLLGNTISIREKEEGFFINIEHIDSYESRVKVIYRGEEPYIREERVIKLYKFLEDKKEEEDIYL